MAILCAIERAAIFLGWVCPIRPLGFSSRHILGICVVFPEPVSPAIIVIWLFFMLSSIVSFFCVIGRCVG